MVSYTFYFISPFSKVALVSYVVFDKITFRSPAIYNLDTTEVSLEALQQIYEVVCTIVDLMLIVVY